MADGKDQRKIDASISELHDQFAELAGIIDAGLAAVAAFSELAAQRRALKALAARVEPLVEALNAATERWTEAELMNIYRMGAQRGAAATGTQFRWSSTHEQSLAQAVKQTNADLLAATQHIEDDTKRLIRASTKQATLDKVLYGNTATQAGRGLERELAKNGVSALVYRNGARHGLREYTAMVLRTQSALAYNRGTLEVGREQGTKYVLLHDGVQCGLYGHMVGPAANGLIVTIDVAEAYPISHPNCIRSCNLTDIATQREADAAMARGELDGVPLKSTEEQAQSELAAAADRQALSQRISARNARMASRIARIASRQAQAS